jgi:hypothetical protein
MIRQFRFVFLYDSSIQPWDADLEVIRRELLKLKDKGFECELLDTKGKTDEQLGCWREEAVAASVWRHQQVRQIFVSWRKGGLPYFRKEVPALLVYEEGESIPIAIYPTARKEAKLTERFQ